MITRSKGTTVKLNHVIDALRDGETLESYGREQLDNMP
jgi:hypothetical protein